VRSSAQRLSSTEQVQTIKDRVQERFQARQGRDPASAPSDPREPAPESREEARSVPGPDDDADSEGAAFEYLEDLAETLGVDAEAFLGLKSKIKVNGEDLETTLKEALGNHQRTAALTQKEQQLAAGRERFLAEQTETLSALKRQFDEAKYHHQAAYQVIEAELNRPEMQYLRQSDPASYLAWQGQFERQKQAIAQSFQNIVANENQAAQQHRERIAQESVSYLRTHIPDFDTRERFEKMAKVFQKRGIAASEAKAILDPRLLRFVSDYADMEERLSAYEKAEAKAKDLARKAPPASVRVGAPKAKDASTQRQISDAKKAQTGLRSRNAIAQAAAAIKLVNRLPTKR
jgi:hypothetical protein